jgi:hypothetical protein
MGEDDGCDDDHDSLQDIHDKDWAGDVTMMCVTTQPDSQSFQQERSCQQPKWRNSMRQQEGYVS